MQTQTDMTPARKRRLQAEGLAKYLGVRPMFVLNALAQGFSEKDILQIAWERGTVAMRKKRNCAQFVDPPTVYKRMMFDGQPRTVIHVAKEQPRVIVWVPQAPKKAA